MPANQNFNPAIPNGPIPGENYTSDIKNYPWHRPPDITNMDKAIVAAMKQLSTKQGSYMVLNLLSMGVSVAQVTYMFVMSGVGAGKWTVDMAILLAGPIARMIQLMATSAKIKFDMGIDEPDIPTVGFFQGLKNVDDQSVKFAQESVVENAPKIEQEAQMNGFAFKPQSMPGQPIQPLVSPSPVDKGGSM